MIVVNALRTHDPVPAARYVVTHNVVPLNAPKRARKRIGRAETLYNVGDTFRVLYVVRVGFLKCSIVSDDGLTQVTGFHMAGDLVGFDGIESGYHKCEVVALEDSEVFVLPFAQCEQWSQESAFGQRLMMRTLAREIVRSHELMIMLGTMRAEQKLAAFLVDLSERYGRLGYSRSRFLIRMTRLEIGSYLGLKLETVSRLLSRFQRDGLVQVDGKSIELVDFPSLWRMSGISPDRQKSAVDPILDREGELAVATNAAD